MKQAGELRRVTGVTSGIGIGTRYTGIGAGQKYQLMVNPCTGLSLVLASKAPSC